MDLRPFFNSAVSGNCVVFGFDGHHINVLIIERVREPHKGADALPGRLMLPEEDVEEVAAGDKKRGDSADRDDDQALRLDKIDPAEDMPAVERDFSAYDAWMGVLSATSIK